MSGDVPLLFRRRPTLEEAVALAREARYSALASAKAHQLCREPAPTVAAWERRAAIWELIENELLGLIGDHKQATAQPPLMEAK